MRTITSLAATVAAAAAVAAPASAAPATDVVDCTSWTGSPAPGSPAWIGRDAANYVCSHQGSMDQDTNPAARAAYLEMRQDPRSAEYQDLSWLEGDPLRYPPLRWDGKRGHWRYLKFTAPYGDSTGPVDGFGSGVVPQELASDQLGAQLFAPLEECVEGASEKCPPGVPTHPRGPYPIVVLQGGSMGNGNEMQWLAQQLAEHGYVAMTSSYYNTSSGWVETVRAMIDFMVSTPADPTPAGDVNPLWKIVDRKLVGLAGYSKWSGGPEVTDADPRIDALVYQGGVGPDARPAAVRTPSLFFGEEYFGPIQPRLSPPDPGSWSVAPIRDATADVMQVVPRASTHYEFATLVTGGKTLFPRSRHGQQVEGYYALAWFDRYLWGARKKAIRSNATARLTGVSFDDSIDASSIGTGTFDPEAGNRPIKLVGRQVADLVSFYYPSGYSLDQGSLECLDMRRACAAAPPPDGDAGGVPGGPGLVVAGPAGSAAGFATREAVTTAGAAVTFVNLDPTAPHDVTAEDRGADGKPLFESSPVTAGQSATVRGTERLAAGSYGFLCSIHPGMRGTLRVL